MLNDLQDAFAVAIMKSGRVHSNENFILFLCCSGSVPCNFFVYYGYGIGIHKIAPSEECQAACTNHCHGKSNTKVCWHFSVQYDFREGWVGTLTVLTYLLLLDFYLLVLLKCFMLL